MLVFCPLLLFTQFIVPTYPVRIDLFQFRPTPPGESLRLYHNYLYIYIAYPERNTKIEIRPIPSYRGSFPSYLVRTVKLRVRISSVTDAAALRPLRPTLIRI